MEFVFVAPREALFPTCYPQGFQRFATPEESQTFLARLRTLGFFVERERAEHTPAWKQIIPYCVVTSGERILLMKRRARGGEPRLHGKLSIGVGGHINPIDHDDGDLVLAAARREIEEELELRGAFELGLAGYLNDDSNPVGAVHLGLVFAAKPSGSVHIREKDVLEGRMVAHEELRELQRGFAAGESLETWSSILLPHIDELASVRLVSVREHAVRQHATTQSAP